MVNKKVIISLMIISSMVLSNFDAIPTNAFAGYDDDNSYNNYGYTTYDYNNYYYTTEDDSIYIDDGNSIQVVQEEENPFTDLTYTIQNEQVTITGYDRTINFYYYTLPSIIDGYPVTAIDDNAFKDCKSLIGIVIPNTVRTVGEYAFSGCKNLQSITFEDTSSLNDLEDDENIETSSSDENSYNYDSYNFNYYDTAENSYDYDYNSYDYNSYSYDDYSQNDSYDYDYNSYDYGNDDYSQNDSYDYDYNSYDYGNDDYSQSDSYDYDYNSYDYGNDDYSQSDSYDYDYNSYDYGNDDYSYNDEEETEETTSTEETEEEEEENIAVNPVSDYSSKLKEGISITHGGINAIMKHAFDGCTNLTTISVPNTLSFLGVHAIEDTKYYANQVEKNESIILGGVYYKYFPNYTYSYEYNDNTAKYEPVVNSFDEEIPEGIISISYSAFENIEGLTNLTMPESLKTIYENAFSGCTALTDITFYDGIQYVGNNAFQNTTWINECQGGFAITGDYLYKYVGKGGSVTIPSRVKIVGNEAFALNSNITRIVVQDGTEKIMGGAFYRCENLQTVVIAGTVLSIGNQAFYGCKNLSRITFAEGLLSIGEKCFVSCSNLTYAIIPSTVSQLGDMCFGFNYDDIHISYSMIDGFTLVGDVGSNVETYARNKMLNFQSREEFVVPKAVKEYEVISDDDEEEEDNSKPLDKLFVFYVIGGLTVLLAILCFILYLVDKKKNPKKYKKKRKHSKTYKNYLKYKKNVQARQNKQSKK